MRKVFVYPFILCLLTGCHQLITGNLAGGDIAGAIAAIYGYKTINGLISANAGLLIVLAAFICVCLVFLRLLNRQFPSEGRQPVKSWIFKVVITFMICAFVFICGFTVFYEKKRAEESGAIYLKTEIIGDFIFSHSHGYNVQSRS